MKKYKYLHISLCVCVCESSICMQIPGRLFHSESGNEPP